MGKIQYLLFSIEYRLVFALKYIHLFVSIIEIIVLPYPFMFLNL